MLKTIKTYMIELVKSTQIQLSNFQQLYEYFASVFVAPADRALLELAELSELQNYSQSELDEQFTWLFEFNVYPYASVYLDPSGMLNAPWTGFVTGVYEALGLQPSDTQLADHLSVLLEATAALLERELKATSALSAEQTRHAQRVILLDHLLPWLPVFCNTISRIDTGIYRQLCASLQDLVCEHSQNLIEAKPKPFTFYNQGENQELDNDKSQSEAEKHLRYLLTTAQSGLMLSRKDIIQAGQTLQLPIRFAERRFMLQNLIAAANDQSLLSELWTLLVRLAQQQQASFVTWEASCPVLQGYWETWTHKLTHTEAFLQEMAETNTT